MLRKVWSYVLNWVKPSQKPDRNQWVAISICLVLAATLWFIVTLNTQEFTSDLYIPIKITNVPDDIQLKGEYPPEVLVRTRGKGINLIAEHFETKPDTIELDFSIHRSQQYFVSSQQLGVVNDALKNNIRAIQVLPDSIALNYEDRDKARVPLILAYELELERGYRNIVDPEASRDSVIVTGPKTQLDTLSFWRTDPGPHIIKGSGRKRIPLEKRPEFKVSPSSISINVDPIAYTERTVKLKVFPVNLKPETRMRISPDSVTAIILVPVDKYNLPERRNLFFEADFAKVDPRSKYLIPRPRNFPEEIILQDFQPRLLEYLIIKEI